MLVQKQEEVLINAQGEYLQLLVEYPETLEKGQSIVPLSNYYGVLNLERYPNAVWDFELGEWIGQGEQRPIIVPELSEIEKLKISQAEQFETILNLIGGM